MSKEIKSFVEFKNYIDSSKAVVIKFYADWCPDCKRMDNFMEEVLEGFDSIPMYNLNKDQFEQISSENDVMGIPSLLVFKEGKKIGHLHSANAKTPDPVTEFLSTFF
ncbi:thioredoxin family protein [Bacillus sp. DJP31]|uniref:thioredoxin family protein n=1 Tax=Bacillus sp. DJP31 TaxID=3409789 RepID=UPI003BB4C618